MIGKPVYLGLKRHKKSIVVGRQRNVKQAHKNRERNIKLSQPNDFEEKFYDTKRIKLLEACIELGWGRKDRQETGVVETVQDHLRKPKSEIVTKELGRQEIGDKLASHPVSRRQSESSMALSSNLSPHVSSSKSWKSAVSPDESNNT